MKPTEAGKQESYQDGFDDAEAGLVLDDNPYLADIAYGSAWETGWLAFHAQRLAFPARIIVGRCIHQGQPVTCAGTCDTDLCPLPWWEVAGLSTPPNPAST